MKTIQKVLRLGILATFVAAPLCDAGQLIRGDEMLHGDKDLDKARRNASYPTEGALQRAAGVPGLCVKIEKKQQDPDCFPNKAGYWFCTGVTSVGCALSKADDDMAKRKVAEEAANKEKAVVIDRNKAITGWVQPDSASIIIPRSETEKQNMKQRAELAKRFKEREDRDTDMAKKRFADQEKAATVGNENQLAANKAQEMKAPAHNAIDNAFANLDKAKEVKANLDGKVMRQGGSGNAIEDAFSDLERQAGKVPTARIGNIENEFEKVEVYRAEQERLRVAALKAKQEREAREREQQARHDGVMQFCKEEIKSEESCLYDACKREPDKTICIESRMLPPPAGTRGLFVTEFECTVANPNPAHSEWESCTRSMASKCTRSGARPSNLEECVRKKIKTL